MKTVKIETPFIKLDSLLKLADMVSSGGEAMTLEPHLKVFDGLKELEESGDTSVVGVKYRYPSADAAFDAACSALKEIIQEV